MAGGAKQETTGKAFEYACLSALSENVKHKASVNIRKDINFENTKKEFDKLSANEQLQYIKAAKKSADIIVPLEPNLDSPDSSDILELGIQPDKQGQKGDVRDVICIRNQKGWEIGLSCKHNHEAVKHSRLSGILDFGKEWLGYPVSAEYWKKITPIFDELTKLKKLKARWGGIDKKNERFYVPPLNAFLEELEKIYKAHSDDVPEKLMQYMLGRYDFYKVITHTKDKTTEVKPFNIYGTLGKSTKYRKVLSRVSLLKMPTKIISMGFKKDSETTVEIYLNEGWAMSLRIHSADTFVESSLKFDIQLIGVPTNMGTRIEAWEE